ncbi:MAG: hypothetical protein Q9219_004905 [cf. Caloplaca sp. 3 TL-2023]
MAGPRSPPTIELVPNDFREVASYLVNTCIRETGDIGGFATASLNNMKQWLFTPEGDLDRPMPYYTSFPTISISNVHPEYYSPGNYDLEIPDYFGRAEFQMAARMPSDSRIARILRARGTRLLRMKRVMDPRGRRIPWWSRPPALSENPAIQVNTTDAGEVKPGVTLPGGGSTGNSGTQTARRKRRDEAAMEDDIDA